MRQILLHGARFFPPKDLAYLWLKPNSIQRHRLFFLGTIFPPKDLVVFFFEFFFWVEQQAKDLVFTGIPEHRIRQLFYSWITSKPEDLFNLGRFHWPLLKAQNNSSISRAIKRPSQTRHPDLFYIKSAMRSTSSNFAVTYYQYLLFFALGFL